MRNCEHYTDSLLAEVHGTLKGEELERLQAHLRTCSTCCREHRRLQELVHGARLAGTSPEPDPGDIRDTARSIRNRLTRQKTVRRRPFPGLAPGRLGIPLAVAAACLLLLLGLTVWSGLDLNPGQPRVAEQKSSLPSKDLKVIENLELLQHMEVVQKLVRITDEAGGNGPPADDQRGSTSLRGSHAIQPSA